MRALIKAMRPCLVVSVFVLTASAVNAQCTASPARETAVSVMNASNYFITFYIDGVNRGTLAPGEHSRDVFVAAGEHLMLADGMIYGERVSSTRNLTVPPGSVCTWTVTNPAKPREGSSRPFLDNLVRVAVISLAASN